MGYVSSVIGVLVLFLFLSLSGCIVISEIDSEFHGGIFTNWETIASTPENDMILTRVDGCGATVGDYRVSVFVTDVNAQIWKFNQCENTGWEPVLEASVIRSAFPCEPGDDKLFTYAESRLPGKPVKCWNIDWYWETVSVVSRYFQLADGSIVGWTIDSGIDSLVRGIKYGWLAGFILTIATLVVFWRKFFPSRNI